MDKVLKVFTAFSGYDSQCLALNRLKKENPGFDYELVGWSEIDENAIKAHNVLFPQYSERNYGDISKVNWEEVPDFDLFTYSSPCFLAGTKVLTNSGAKNIEDIDENDYVITHTGSYKKVIEPMSRTYSGTIYRIVIDRSVVMCTPNHPFYCATKDDVNKASWIEAKDLQIGFHLPKKVVDFKLDGCTPIIENRQIESMETIAEENVLVYNMEVEDDHSYTANELVVHNCTDFSLAGKQMGGEEGSGTRSSLLWECRRCIQAKKPKYLLLENVTALVSSKFKPLFDRWCDTVASMGYDNFWQTLNAKDYGVPQNRDRVFLVSIRRDSDEDVIDYNFPNPIERTCKIEDVLEEKGTVAEKYFINQQKVDEWVVDNENRIVEYIAERENMSPKDLFFDENDFLDKDEKLVYKSPFNEVDEFEDDEDEADTLDVPVVEKCPVNAPEEFVVSSDVDVAEIMEKAVKKTPKSKKFLKKHRKKTDKVGHCIKRIPTPTCTGDVAPTLMATGYANADYKNFYSVGHFPKLGILEVWKEDTENKKKD